MKAVKKTVHIGGAVQKEAKKVVTLARAKKAASTVRKVKVQLKVAKEPTKAARAAVRQVSKVDAVLKAAKHTMKAVKKTVHIGGAVQKEAKKVVTHARAKHAASTMRKVKVQLKVAKEPTRAKRYVVRKVSPVDAAL